MADPAVREQPKGIFNKHFILLMILSLINAFGYSMISTQVASYSTDVLGSSLSFAGWIVGVYSFAALLMRPVAGFAADKLSKRNICVYTTFGIFGMYLLYIIVPNPGLLFVLRIVHGMLFGINGTANLAMASEYIPKERMSEGLGYFGLGQILSQAFGPQVGKSLKDLIDYRGMFLSIAIGTLVGVVLVAIFFKAEKVVKQQEKTKISIKDFIAVECIVYSLTGGMFSLTNGVVNSFLEKFALNERGITSYALFFTVVAAVMFVIRTFIGRFFDRISLMLVVVASLIVTAAGMVLIGRSFSLAPLLIAAAMKAFGQGSGQISLQSACIKQVSPAKVGIATSTYYIGADVGNTLGPILGGEVADHSSFEMMYYATAALMIVAMFGFIIYESVQIKKRKLASQTAGKTDEALLADAEDAVISAAEEGSEEVLEAAAERASDDLLETAAQTLGETKQEK